MSGTKHLRIASLIIIILGLASIILTYFLAGEVDSTNLTVSGEEALKQIIISYCLGAFQVFAGLFGLILSKKKSLFTVILGLLLFLPALINFINLDDNITLIVVNIITLIIPYYYLHNAYKNFKDSSK